MMSKLKRLKSSFYIVLVHLSLSAQAQTLLPYSTRTMNYSAWTPALRGDINTIGMGGATLALATSISSAQFNPAGLALQMPSVSAQINRSQFEDQAILRNQETIESAQWGLAVNPPPNGFGLAYYSPMSEGGIYQSSNTQRKFKSEISLKEYRFTYARALFSNRLSLGASLNLIKAVREIGVNDYNQIGWGVQVGALYQLKNHFVLGLSYSPEKRVNASTYNPVPADLPGFNQAVILPEQAAIGLGWMPNRFFKAGFAIHRTSKTDRTALFADQSILTGQSTTYEPRIGASYVVFEYDWIKAEAATGIYYEPTRLSSEEDRFHHTFGIEVNPYFVNLGFGFDLARNYQNTMITVGLDLVRTLRTFEIIPNDPVKPIAKFWPKPFEQSSVGMPEGMKEETEKGNEDTVSVDDVATIIKEIPKKIEMKIQKIKKRYQKDRGKNLLILPSDDTH